MYPGASGCLMGIAILARQIRVDLGVVRSYCVGEVDLTEVLLKADPCGVLLGRGPWPLCALSRVSRSILLLQSGGKPVSWPRPSTFCLALDGGIDFVTEFKDERLTHTFPPASFRTCCLVRKSLRLPLEIVLQFLPWCLWRLTPGMRRARLVARRLDALARSLHCRW